MNHCAAPIRVLVVEPHADTRELYDLGLRAAGFEVVTAHDAPSAMIACAMQCPHGGSDMLTRFAAMGVPVIALTTGPAVARRLPHGLHCRAAEALLSGRGGSRHSWAIAAR